MMNYIRSGLVGIVTLTACAEPDYSQLEARVDSSALGGMVENTAGRHGYGSVGKAAFPGMYIEAGTATVGVRSAVLDSGDAGEQDASAPDGGTCLNQLRWYEDADWDGFRSSRFVYACEASGTYIKLEATPLDCNDEDEMVNAGMPELCDGKDNNCRGGVDEGAVCAARMMIFRSNRSGNYDIYSVDPGNPADLINLTNHPAYDQHPAWSPDKTRIAFVSDRDNPAGEIYTMNADGSEVRRLTDNSYGDFRPSWSPDGARIAFQSNERSSPQVYVMNADGSRPENVSNVDYTCYDPNWSPDGIHITFYRDGGGLSVLNLRDRTIAAITESGILPDYYPDGIRIVYIGGAGNLYSVNADGSGVTDSGVSGYSPSCSSDGRRIAFEVAGAGIYALDLTDRTTSLVISTGFSDSEPDW